MPGFSHRPHGRPADGDMRTPGGDTASERGWRAGMNVFPGQSFGRPGTFAALAYRNYRLWFAGQLISLLGTWMQMTAQGYLVFELTRSSAYLGYVAFASGVPTWLFMVYGGAVADRMSRRTLMVITQTAMMVLAFVLAGLTLADIVRPWHILVMAFLLGTANAFDAPARQAFVLEMVERRDLTNAIALNSTLFNSATAIGPAAAGFTYAAVGPGWCFFLNAVSFLGVIAALLMMRLPPAAPRSARASAGAEILEGLRYTAHHPVIRTMILLIGAASLFGIGLFTLMPAWAVEILNGDARTLGTLQSFRGLGALIGALGLATASRYRFKGRLVTAGSFGFPLMLLAFSLTRHLPVALLVLLFVGVAQILLMNAANVIVQSRVADGLRGRVMGVYTLTFFGLMPLGGLLAGTIADRMGDPLAVAIGGGALLAFSGAIWLAQPALRSLEVE